MVLVDTSVWINHLRDGHEGLCALLEKGLVSCHPLIIGGLACGHLLNRTDIISLLHALPQVSVAGHDEVLAFIEAQGLAGRGLGYIDVHLLAAAILSGVSLWTLDRRCHSTARELHAAYGTETVAD